MCNVKVCNFIGYKWEKQPVGNRVLDSAYI